MFHALLGFMVVQPLVDFTSVHSSGAHFKNDFSILIQIRWKFHSALIQVIVKWMLWNFAHDMTVVLLCHVQNFVVIWYPIMDLHWSQFYFGYVLWWKICLWDGPQVYFPGTRVINHITPEPVKQPWRIRVNSWHELRRADIQLRQNKAKLNKAGLDLKGCPTVQDR